MKFLSISFSLSDFPTHHKISDFLPISRLGGNPVRIKHPESYFMKDLPETEMVEVASRK